MNITVIGGGNIGTLMAAEAANKGHKVTIYTSKPELWQKKIEVYDINDTLLISAEISKITNSMKEAVVNAEHIWVTVPAEAFKNTADKMLPYVVEGQKIGIIPGFGGAEFSFRRLVDKGCTLYGFQRVHSIARLKKYGKATYQLGRKSKIEIGSIPANEVSDICKCIEHIFDIPCVELPNYLSVSLTPSNPILHTSRLYSMFKDYKSGIVYDRNYFFYKEWSLEASELMIACDKELQELCSEIPMDLRNVHSLRDYYDSYTAKDMQQKISSLDAVKKLKSPMIKVENGWIPDFSSRYFKTDFPYGIHVIIEIADIFNVETPTMDAIWSWYVSSVSNENENILNINMSMNKFLNLYHLLKV